MYLKHMIIASAAAVDSSNKLELAMSIAVNSEIMV